MNNAFVDACKGKPVEHTPVWFMRQAGRYLPSYRRIRRERSVIEVAKDPELSSSVAVDAVKELGVDAAIIFADIMLPLEGVGIDFEIQEDLGPVIKKPIRSMKSLEELRPFRAREHVPYVLQGIQSVLQKLDESVPVIGFSGGPFTLASYVIEGVPTRTFTLTKKMIYESPELWERLMRRLTDLTIGYLEAQIREGVSVVQLFDSWVGCLSRNDYERFVMKYTKEIFAALPKKVPAIHFCADSAALLDLFCKTGCDVVSVDWRLPIDDVWRTGGEAISAQGNLDPVAAVVGGYEMERQVGQILERASHRGGHIFNLGHGVLRETPPENLREIVEFVHRTTKRRN